MNKFKFLLLFTSVLFLTCTQAQKVQFKQVDKDNKVEVFVDNKFFTAFIAATASSLDRVGV
jgi:uncharacterized pyridoxamine 5'-phosphate oxidase family protein